MAQDPSMNLMSNPTNDTLAPIHRSKGSLMQQYIRAMHAPFNSVSPRFNYAKQYADNIENPGPGSYAVLNRHKLNHSTSPAFKAASREKASFIGQVIKNADPNVGPGQYDNNRSTIVKKTFNANL